MRQEVETGDRGGLDGGCHVEESTAAAGVLERDTSDADLVTHAQTDVCSRLKQAAGPGGPQGSGDHCMREVCYLRTEHDD